MPDRVSIDAQILQYEYRPARSQFGQQGVRISRQDIGEAASSPRRCEQLLLQAALATGQVDLRDELFRESRCAACFEHGREGGRPALIIFLREERGTGQLHLRR